jgi:PAS domain S-box-containing protein
VASSSGNRVEWPARPLPVGDDTARLALLASVVDSSDDAIFSTTLDGVITSWNKAAETIFGYTADEIVGEHVSVLIDPDRANETAEILERIRNGEQVEHYETTRRTKQGDTVAVAVTVSPIQDAAGTIVGASSIARDITERERVEDQVRSAAQYARSLIEASVDPLVTISPEGKITDVNEATIRVTGVERERLVGTDFADYFTEPDRAREGYRQVFAEGSATDYPLTIRHTDGALTDVLYNASVYKDAAGSVLGVFAAARDVTAQKRVLREFSETKTFLDNILQSSTKYSIIGKDLNHRILSWNEGACRNYGYTGAEIIGMDSNILHTPEDQESGAVDHLLQTAHDVGLAEDNFQRVRKDGSRFEASVVVTRRDNADGEPIGYLLMSNDISDKKQAEAELARRARELEQANVDLGRSNDELEQFAYIASHDLSEPLRAISGPISLVARRYQGQLDDEAEQFIAFAVDGCQRMQKMIDDLLVYSRVGRVERSLEVVDCNLVINTVLTALGPAIAETGAVIHVEPLPVVRAESTQLSQVFQNLILNALKFVTIGVAPEVAVAAEPVGAEWRFTVTDNGIGIDPQHRDRIFGMFKRLHSREDYPGTGIGLALVKKIVERHGGRIGVEDNPAGAGTRFWFTFPAEEAP